MKIYKSITAFILMSILSGCFGDESVRSTKQYPFVINKITKNHDGTLTYSKGEWEHPFSQTLTWDKQSITLDTDYGYKIGDTLRFFNRNSASNE